MKKGHNRRDFIKLAGLASLGLSASMVSAFNLKAIQSAALDNSGTKKTDYKALVCLFLAGGNDSYNMLVPKGNNEYAKYSQTRSEMAIPQNDLVGIKAKNSDGRSFGLHPSMPDIAALFNAGDLAFLCNTGSLIQPTTKKQYKNKSVLLPIGLFSHADMQKHWQSANPVQRTGIGWGGKIADMMHDVNDNDIISMNISLSGTNIFQYGNKVSEFSIKAGTGAENIAGYGYQKGFGRRRTQAIDQFFNRKYNNVFEKTYMNILKNAREGGTQFEKAIKEIPELQTEFAGDRISQSFKMVAKTIMARKILGFKRQIFFIKYNGWDHHSDLLTRQKEMLKVVNDALKSFAEALNEIDMFNNVTTFTMSDFGRTLTSNGNGTDHAWGGNTFMMGGAVKGKILYGKYPSLALGTDIELGKGVLLPTTANNLYFAELALWFGVKKSELPLIFPNITNFYDINSKSQPLGFLDI